MAERFGIKDYKGHCKIVVDNMPSKEICNLSITSLNKRLTISGQTYELEKISNVEISKYKKKLVDSAFALIS
jgi:hypothetical protein